MSFYEDVQKIRDGALKDFTPDMYGCKKYS